MAIKLHATANEIELKKNRIKSLDEVTDHDEGYPTALAAKQYADSLKVTVDTELSDKSDNPLQNKVITEELKKLKELGESQSDWNINDTTNPAYIKNRPFYSEKVESDIWEFELPIMNETTLEGIYPSIPMPDADLSQFTDGQELEYEEFAAGELQSSDTAVFIKSVDIRNIFDGAEIDADVPNTLMGIGYDSESSPDIIFGVRCEIIASPSGQDAKVVFHNDPNHCWVDSMSYDGNSNYPIQVKFKNFKNKVVKDYQIPSKYINWSEYVNDRAWKWEYKIEPMPFSTQPTIVKGNVSKLKADTFYLVQYTSAENTTFKLAYGENAVVDDTLEFNRNNAWTTDSKENYPFIHCISVDTTNNTAVFGKPYLSDSALLGCIVKDNTKKLRIQMTAKAFNTHIQNSPIPILDSGTYWGTAMLILADGKLINGNSYEVLASNSSPVFETTNNAISVSEQTISESSAGLILPLGNIPACIIDEVTSKDLSKVTHPQYKGLLKFDLNLTVAPDRRSYSIDGSVTGVCWNEINSVTFANPYDASKIKATYPIQIYSQLKPEDKKLFFKKNEANGSLTQLIFTAGINTLTGFSITVEGEVE